MTDEMLAEFVVNSHFKSQPKGGKMDDSEPQDGVQGSSGSSDPEVCDCHSSCSFEVYVFMSR